MNWLLYLALFILLALSIVVWASMAISGRCSREEEMTSKLEEALESELFGAETGI